MARSCILRRLALLRLPCDAPQNRQDARSGTLSDERFRELVEEATVDAYGEAKEAGGWLALIDGKRRLPI